MNYGREWNLPPLSANQVYIDWRVAQSLGVDVGDVIYIRFPGYSFYSVFLLPDAADVWFTAQVMGVLTSPMGKSAHTDIDPLVFAEYSHFLPALAQQLSTVFEVTQWQRKNLFHYAQRVVVCLFVVKTIVP